MKFIFYQNMLSIHQHALLTALAKRHEVTLVAEQTNLAFRNASGWKAPDFPGCRVVVSPDEVTLRGLAKTEEAVHVFTGLRGFAMVKRALQYSLVKNVLRIAYVEPLDTLGWKAPLRKLLYRLSSHRYNMSIRGFLCTGETGVNCYRRAGFDPNKLFEFGYFTNPPLLIDDCGGCSELPSVVFVGTLNRGKNVLALAEALVDLRAEFDTADFIGKGALKDRVLEIIGQAPNIYYLGSVDNSQIGGLMGRHDILVLPSLYDGWGAVVNEALQCGCRVVVSDNCGAASLIEGSSRGTVYSNRRKNGLKDALRREFGRGRSTPDMRREIRDWSARCISGTAAAEYLERIVECVANGAERPLPPWQV